MARNSRYSDGDPGVIAIIILWPTDFPPIVFFLGFWVQTKRVLVDVHTHWQIISCLDILPGMLNSGLHVD